MITAPKSTLRSPGRLLGRCLLALTTVAVLVGCSDGSQQVASIDAEAGAPAEGARTLGIQSIEPPVGNKIVVITAPTLAEDGPGECRGTVTSDITESPNQVLVDLRITTNAVPPYEGCDLESRAITVTFASVPDEVRIRDSMGGMFSYIGGRIESCPAGPMVCNNDPASCDGATLHDAIANSDVPAHFRMPLSRCEAPFAVVDVDYGAGACAPTGEASTNPCANQQVHRMYWRITADRWDLIAYDDNAGCGEIHEVAPEFPKSLCQDLPAIT
jgi:hypothetical protein